MTRYGPDATAVRNVDPMSTQICPLRACARRACCAWGWAAGQTPEDHATMPRSAPRTSWGDAGSRLDSGQEFGTYRVERLLGKGGMGEVYEAEDLESGRHVALKVLTHGLGDPGDRTRFLREGRLAASINHPHTVYVYGTDEIEGLPVITMELASGGTLKDRVKEKGPMPPTEAVDAILQVIAGLEAARAAGVLHRDVKPSNCFVDSEGRSSQCRLCSRQHFFEAVCSSVRSESPS